MRQDNSISVIIPVYNRPELLCRALDSVLTQTLKPLEIIVVDDGSDDGLTPNLDNYPHVRRVRQEHAGVSRARNHGVELSSGEWIAFLDSDDEWKPGKLERQMRALEGSEFQICHSDEIWIRNGVRVNPHKKHKKYGGDIFGKCLSLCLISPSSTVIQKTLFDSLGGFDENLPACEDYDLWLRITAKHQVAFVEEALIIKHGGHNDRLSAKFWGMDRFRIQSMENLLVMGELSCIQESQLLEELIRKCEIFTKGARNRRNPESEQLYSAKLQYFCKRAEFSSEQTDTDQPHIDKHIKKS